MKLKVTYDPIHGDVIQDGTITSYIDDVIFIMESSPVHYEIRVSNELIIFNFQLAIKEKRILSDDIGFYFNGEQVKHTSNGVFIDSPVGFCDNGMNILLQLRKIK